MKLISIEQIEKALENVVDNERDAQTLVNFLAIIDEIEPIIEHPDDLKPGILEKIPLSSSHDVFETSIPCTERGHAKLTSKDPHLSYDKMIKPDREALAKRDAFLADVTLPSTGVQFDMECNPITGQWYKIEKDDGFLWRSDLRCGDFVMAKDLDSDTEIFGTAAGFLFTSDTDSHIITVSGYKDSWSAQYVSDNVRPATAEEITIYTKGDDENDV